MPLYNNLLYVYVGLALGSAYDICKLYSDNKSAPSSLFYFFPSLQLFSSQSSCCLCHSDVSFMLSSLFLSIDDEWQCDHNLMSISEK